MVDLLMVDWLGRGGITHTTQAWVDVARDAGWRTEVISRATGSIEAAHAVERRIPGLVGSLDSHLRTARRAVSVIRSLRPPVVYLQNYWIPPVELAVSRAAREAGSRVVVAVHNHRPHQLRAGSSLGLGRLLSSADVVVTHSEYVSREVLRRYGISPVLVEHPVQTRLLDVAPAAIPEVEQRPDGRQTAVLFGVLGRGYKGGRVLAGLDRLVADDWLVVAAGVGAAEVEAAEVVVDRFLEDGELVWLLKRSTTVLLPYLSATQSGAVVLAQALGVPPIATAVGGIPEQIAHTRTGLLLSPDAGVDEWAALLHRISSDLPWWGTVREATAEHAMEQHRIAGDRWLRALGL